MADLAGQAVSGTFYKRTREAARTLLKTPMSIRQNPDGTNMTEVLECPIIQSLRFNNTKGKIFVRFNEDVIPYLTKLKGIGFTQYSVKGGILCMDSAYAYRLHDLVIRWGDIGMKEISVDDFRWMIGLEDGKYPRFNSLRQWVIEPSVKQVNKHSTYDVTVGYRRARRQVIALQFAFKPKNKPETKTANVNLGTLLYGVPKLILESRLAESDTYEHAAMRIKSMRLPKESWIAFYNRQVAAGRI